MAARGSSEAVWRFEQVYRPYACRSDTPIFSALEYERKDTTARRGAPDNRTAYQRDRDKLLYCKPFRRLRLKSQIFPEHAEDHLRTRLEHTLEVAQLSRHIARGLGLNEDLVDAISLGHDIGHAPFAHSGERALHAFLEEENQKDGFRHNWHGLRVVDLIESSYRDFPGFNLRFAVRVGILTHTGHRYRSSKIPCRCALPTDYDEYWNWPYQCFEVQLVRLSDDIAQVIHDFEDGLESKTFDIQTISEKDGFGLIKRCANAAARHQTVPNDSKLLLSRVRSELIYLLTSDIIQSSNERLEEWSRQMSIGTPAAFNEYVTSKRDFPDSVALTEEKGPFEDLKNALHETIVRSERVTRMDAKAAHLLRAILRAYCKNPLLLPRSVLEAARPKKPSKKIWKKLSNREAPTRSELNTLRKEPAFLRCIVDYVAGMTDRFALAEYDRLFAPYPRRDYY